MAVNILLKRSATASKRPVGASMAFGELNLNYDAATGGLFYKDSLGAVVKVGPCQVSATAPNSSPAGSTGNSAGEFWFDTSTQTLKLYDGTSWVEAGGMVQGITGTAPITVDNSDPLNPVIGASAASTSAPGVVQLNDTTSSTSTTEALTANQGRNLQQQIDALVVSSNLTLAGTLDASTGNLVTVTTEGAAQGFAIGDPLPSPAAGNAEFFVIATVGAASYTPPGGTATEVHVGDWFLSSGTVWNFLDVGFQAAYASTTSPGIVQLATDAEVQAGVDTEHAVVPSSLQSKLSDSVSTTSSTTIASSTAAKAAYDAGVQGQTDAAAAQATANQAVLDASDAQGTADQAVLDAAAAQSTANQAVLDAAAAQSAANNAQTDATQALSDAAGAQSTANLAVANAAAAQATANAAMPLSGGTFTNNVTFSAGPGLGIIVALGTITPGSGYAPGVYSGVELTGGTGVAAIADITVGLSGEVTNVDLVDGGIDYTVGDVLTYNLVDGAGWSVPVIQTSAPVGATFTIDSPSTLLNNGFLVQNGGATFNDQVNISNQVFFSDTTQTYFDPGSTIGFNGDAEVNGTFTFNTAPVFPAGVDIGAAEQVTYDNAASGLTASNVQDAIDEVDGLANAAQATADAALPKAGGEMTGNIVLTNTAQITTDNTANLELIADQGMSFLLQSTNFSGQIDAVSLSISANSSDADAFYLYTPGTATIELGTANLVTTNGLQVNGDAGTAGYILQSNGAGAAPTWVPQSEGDVTGVSGTAPITVDNTDPQNPVVGINAASTSAAGAVQLNDTVTSTSDAEAATANAVKTAYDAAVAAQGDATQALSDAAAAQATADAALPKAGGTMTGNITFQDADEGVVFSDASSITGISNSVSTTSSIVAASSTAVKVAYDAAIAAQAAAPLASATVLFVNVTTGNNATAARGTARPYSTITAALAAASEGDTIFVAPGTYVESPTLSKGVNLIGTFVDQAISSGPKVSGTFTVSITGAGTRNWSVSNLQFQASSVGNNSVVVSNNSFGSGGIGAFTNCFFQQFTSASITEQCFATSGTWTRSLYLRNCTFDGNFTHNAGTTTGASGYIVIDNLLGIAGNDKYYKVMTGTCEFRNPSNALAPVLHTGGFAVFSNVLAWISNVAATTTIFGGTGFAYKGTSAGLGQAVAYFTGQGVNVVEGSTWGKLSIGSNVVYAFGNVNYDTSLATLSGIPLTVASPNPNGVQATMARPQWNYLTTTSSVAAANQLGVVLDSSNGNVYTVSAYDAGTY